MLKRNQKNGQQKNVREGEDKIEKNNLMGKKVS